MLTNLTQELVLKHLPLAKKIAKSQFRKTPPQVQYDELESAAYMGLVDAATRYDGERDFEKYASFRMIGEIKDYLRSLKWDRNTNNLPSIPEGFDVAAEKEPENFDEILEDFTEKRVSAVAKQILRMYYGERLPISTIAGKMKLSDARISQLIKQNIETIRYAMSA
jgi:RNA polymerase sigma factor (sigma-70 family)